MHRGDDNIRFCCRLRGYAEDRHLAKKLISSNASNISFPLNFLPQKDSLTIAEADITMTGFENVYNELQEE